VKTCYLSYEIFYSKLIYCIPYMVICKTTYKIFWLFWNLLVFKHKYSTICFLSSKYVNKEYIKNNFTPNRQFWKYKDNLLSVWFVKISPDNSFYHYCSIPSILLICFLLFTVQMYICYWFRKWQYGDEINYSIDHPTIVTDSTRKKKEKQQIPCL